MAFELTQILLRRALRNIPTIEVGQYDSGNPSSAQDLADLHTIVGQDSQLVSWYTANGSLDVSWQAAGAETPIGQIRIQPLHRFMQDWEGVVYFDKDSDRQAFKIFDFHTDELCVGLFLAAENDQRVFVYDFSEEPVSLQIDLAGYVDLLLLSRGFQFWPIVLRNLLQERTSPEQEQFIEWMPRLFPDFSMAAFEQTFAERRLV